MVTIDELRDIADYTINNIRHKQGKSNIKRINTYPDADQEPSVLLDAKIRGETKTELKKTFLALAHQKAEILGTIISAMDNYDRSGVNTISLWGNIQLVFKGLKHFFEDLRDKSEDSFTQLSRLATEVINKIRKQVGAMNISSDSIRSQLNGVKRVGDLLNPDNFEPVLPEYKNSKLNQLISVIYNTNSIAAKYANQSIAEPEGLVRNLVDLGKNEYDLNSCIEKLIKVDAGDAK